MTLKSISQHNLERTQHAESAKTGLTGGACPNCGDELIETLPGSILTSYPPQKSVRCRECGLKTSIFA